MGKTTYIYFASVYMCVCVSFNAIMQVTVSVNCRITHLNYDKRYAFYVVSGSLIRKTAPLAMQGRPRYFPDRWNGDMHPVILLHGICDTGSSWLRMYLVIVNTVH